MIPNYDKQLRYAAYVRLSTELLARFTASGYTRFPQVLLKSIVDKSTASARDYYDCVIPSEPKNTTEAVNKFILLSRLDAYKTHVYRAASVYHDAFAKLEGPTKNELKDVMSGIIDQVIKDLLVLEED